MRYLSVCSGIEAATAAWEPLGWSAAAFAEIEKFPSAVLAHHYPNVPNLGDFTKIEAADVGAVDVLVGGTPCQSFSVAGLRGGLADDRGNLALEFLRLAERTRPKWLVWENVPGVLSSNGGRDFGSILGGMVELGYGFAYRVADAQFFGVPQRRRRVFVVGYLGDWRRAAAVLFERHSLQGHSPPSRKAGQGVAPTIASRPSGGGGLGTDFDCDGGLVANCLNAKGGAGRLDGESETFITHSLRADGFDASEDGTGRGTPIIPIQNATRGKDQNGLGVGGDTMFTLDQGSQHAVAFAENSRAELRLEGGDGRTVSALKTGGGKPGQSYPANAFSSKDYGNDALDDCAPTLRAGAHSKSHANAGVPPAVAFRTNAAGQVDCQGDGIAALTTQTDPTTQFVKNGSAVRRLTPRECERLQGFRDDYTLIPYRGKLAADGPRYKALGNSMAVPVMSWIGQRIEMVQQLQVA
jgi:DNA (cytosine-5)-methyltransferase 1